MRNILNIAHRGFTKIFPDNTIEAFQAAIDIGVDGIEFDVQETADRKFVVYHDSELFGTTINKLSLAEVERMKLRGKFKIPTLEEALSLCTKRLKLVVELKQVQSLDILVGILRMRAQSEDTIIASIRTGLLSRLLELAPDAHRAFITEHQVKDLGGVTKLAHSHVIIVKCPFVTDELIREVRSHKLSLFVWGCKRPKDIRDTLKLDINGIISDSPELVSKFLRTMA